LVACLWRCACVIIAAFSVGVGSYLDNSRPRRSTEGRAGPADFTNNAGEDVSTARCAALAVQLEQSPFLRVMDDAQIRQFFA
jgi:hypothetical protein